MTKKEIIQNDYNNNSKVYQLVLPIETALLIPEDDSVRLLSQIMEELDYTKLIMAYSSQGRNPVVEPKTLFKILIYAYMNDIYSSRKIEKACKRDINFMWLLKGRKAPDHNTIARFRTKRIADIVDDLFNQLVKKLKEFGEIQYKNIYIDGTKIEANANKYTFVWKKATDKFRVKLNEKLKSLIQEMNIEFNTNYMLSEPKTTIKHLQEIMDFLRHIKEQENIEFVNGKGTRKTKIQRFIESLTEYIERQQKYDDYDKTFDGRNSFSKTDKDATFMHLKEDHMRNSQLKPAYNMQIGVEGEYVVGIDVSSERSDQLTFIPFLERLQESLEEKYENVIADAGYESEENYMYLEKNNQNPYIKPQTYENMKKKSFKSLINKRENMIYNEEKDEYTCHGNKILKPIGKKFRKSKSGYESQITTYECEDCSNCKDKAKCTKAIGNKRLDVSKNFVKRRLKSLENIINPEGVMLRMNRSIQVEGAFGVLKEDHGFRKFLTRGKKNVRIEFTLLCFGYNINKLHNKIQKDRCGILLHEIKVS
jgi:Transposase and inactivated derivatives